MISIITSSFPGSTLYKQLILQFWRAVDITVAAVEMYLMLIDLLESSKVIGLCPNQEEILKQVLNGRDILFCSPTGSGKSLSR